ncbi:MAG: hypothetical protein ACYDEV_17245 [Acidiferrobacter sp.]
MKTRVLVAAVLSATLGIAMASASYADIDTQAAMSTQTNVVAAGSPVAVSASVTGATNAATPAVPGSDGTPTTPAIPGNPTARAAYDQGESTLRLEQLETAHPKVERPTITRPKVERPTITRPEIERPEITRPEITRPEIERPVIER